MPLAVKLMPVGSVPGRCSLISGDFRRLNAPPQKIGEDQGFLVDLCVARRLLALSEASLNQCLPYSTSRQPRPGGSRRTRRSARDTMVNFLTAVKA